MPTDKHWPIKGEWLLVSLLSAGSRILETASMILPVKAVFVLMKPEILPDFWLQSGLGITHLLVSIIILTLIMLFTAKLLDVLARHRAHNLHPEILDADADADADKMALITTKISSAVMVMFVFIVIIGFVDLSALLIIVFLLIISRLPSPLVRHEVQDRIYQLFGITTNAARYRFISQLLFQLYFMSILTLVILQDSTVTVVLLLVMLVGRRLFQEYSRLRVGLFQREELRSGKLISE